MPTEVDERPRVYLDNVHLKGYKSIEDLTIGIQRGLNILIGKNGSGKSNFLELIDLAFRSKDTTNIHYGFAALEFVSEDKHKFLIEYEKDPHIKLVKEGISDGRKIVEKFFIDGKPAIDSSDENYSGRFMFNNKQRVFTGINRGLFYLLDYQHIYSIYIKYNLPNNLTCIDAPGMLRGKVDNGVLYWSFPETLNFIQDIFWHLDSANNLNVDHLDVVSGSKIIESLVFNQYIIDKLKLITSIEDVRFSPNINLYTEDKSLIVENVKLDFKVNGNWLPWSQLSDGTRRLFCIICQIIGKSGMVLIEEPELGIHPHQFHLLMTFLKEQSEDKQIILSTHSPKALDHLNENELGNILIAEYDLTKGTQIRHLTDEETDKAKDYIKEVGFFSDYWLLSDLEQW